jgi:hypothetical protein
VYRDLLKGSSNWNNLDSTLEIPIILSHPLYVNDFDSRLACPLGRLGAARPPAADNGMPEEAGPMGRFEELFFALSRSRQRCQP